MNDDFADELRRQLDGRRVPHDPAAAARMIEAATAGPLPAGRRAWIAPATAAAAIVGLGAGVVAVAASGDDGSGSAAGRRETVYNGRYEPCATVGPVSGTPTLTGTAVARVSYAPWNGSVAASRSVGAPSSTSADAPPRPKSTAMPNTTSSTTPSTTSTAGTEAAPTAAPTDAPTSASGAPSAPASGAASASGAPSALPSCDFVATAGPMPTSAQPSPAASTRIIARTAAGRTSYFAVPAVRSAAQIALAEVVIDNPRGDTGTLRLQQGGQAGFFQILKEDLGTFRATTHHWNPPIRFRGPGPVLQVQVTCTNASSPCTPSVELHYRTAG